MALSYDHILEITYLPSRCSSPCRFYFAATCKYQIKARNAKIKDNNIGNNGFTLNNILKAKRGILFYFNYLQISSLFFDYPFIIYLNLK